jgi:hypothetical protein
VTESFLCFWKQSNPGHPTRQLLYQLSYSPFQSFNMQLIIYVCFNVVCKINTLCNAYGDGKALYTIVKGLRQETGHSLSSSIEFKNKRILPLFHPRVFTTLLLDGPITWCKILPERLTLQNQSEIPRVSKTGKFITLPTTACHENQS